MTARNVLRIIPSLLLRMVSNSCELSNDQETSD